MSKNEHHHTSPSFMRPFAFAAIGLVCVIALVLMWARRSPERPETPIVLDSGTPSAPTTPLVPLPTTPPQAPGLAGFLNPEAENRLPPDFEALVPAVTEPDEVDAVVALLRDQGEADNLRNEAINMLRRSKHLGLVAELLAVLDDTEESERFRGFAAQHLGISLHEGEGDTAVITSRLRLALHDHHLDVRRESLRALERVADPEAVILLARGFEPGAPDDVRDLVIRAAYRAGRRDLAANIRPYLTSPDPVVRIAAIYVLGQWRDESSRPALITALRDPNPRVAAAAELALATLGPTNP